MIEKHGSAIWTGGLKDGSGMVSTQSGLLKDVAYSFAKRFGDEAGSNPEELIGAAHAACYSMALSKILGDKGVEPDRLEATSTVTLDPDKGEVTKAHLDVRMLVPGAEEAAAKEAAEAAKDGCPISKLLNAEITLNVKIA